MDRALFSLQTRSWVDCAGVDLIREGYGVGR